MSAGTEARAPSRRKPATQVDAAIRLDRGIVCKLRVVSALRGEPMNAILADLLRGPVDQLYSGSIRELEHPGG